MNPVGTVAGLPPPASRFGVLDGFPVPLDEGDVVDRGRVAEPSPPLSNGLPPSVDAPLDESPDDPAPAAGVDAAVVAVVVAGVVVGVVVPVVVGDATTSVVMSASAAEYRLSDKGA